MKNLPTIEKPGPADFGGEFYPTFKEEIIPILCRPFQNAEEGGGGGGGAHFPTHSVRRVCIPPLKPDRDITRMLQTSIHHEYRHEKAEENINKSGVEIQTCNPSSQIGRLRQKDQKFEGILGTLARPCCKLKEENYFYRAGSVL